MRKVDATSVWDVASIPAEWTGEQPVGPEVPRVQLVTRHLHHAASVHRVSTAVAAVDDCNIATAFVKPSEHFKE